MNRDLYAKAAELFVKAADFPQAERDAFLKESCGDDEELRREVEDLL